MSRFNTRLQRIETSVGQVDEHLYWSSVFDLQPKLRELYWQGQEEGWPVLKYMYRWLELEQTLPPKPNAKPVDPEARDRAVAKMLELLNGTEDRLDHAAELAGFDLDALTEEIRAENYAYLKSDEHRQLMAKLGIKE